jgi:hypothetical protein
MRFTLDADLGQPRVIALPEDELPTLRSWVTAAAMSGTLLGSLATLAWLLPRRDTDGTA